MREPDLKLPWTDAVGADSDIVLATRVRLARNITGRVMPQRLDAEQGGMVLNQCKGILSSMSEPHFDFYGLEELTPQQRGVMVEEHLISPDFLKSSPYAGVAVSEKRDLSIMINEEDHIRIQCILSGLQIDRAWQEASAIDDKLGAQLEYAFDKQLGYLTACPTNLGTGLRASVMLHLPALNIGGRLKSIFANLSRMGMTVRGAYGEGSEAYGNIFQISNQITLGLSEVEIIENMQNVILQIVEAEREARKTLYQNNKVELTDNIWRSYALLAHSRQMSREEMMNRLSYLRLGVDMGLLEGISAAHLTKLMVLGQDSYVKQQTGKELSAAEANICRAAQLRAMLPLLQ